MHLSLSSRASSSVFSTATFFDPDSCLPAAFSKPHLQEQWEHLSFGDFLFCFIVFGWVFFVCLFVVLSVRPLWLQWKAWMSEGKCPRVTKLEKWGKTNQNLLCGKIPNSNVLDLVLVDSSHILEWLGWEMRREGARGDVWRSTCAFIFLCGGSKFHNCLPWAQRELSQQFRAAAAEEAVGKWGWHPSTGQRREGGGMWVRGAEIQCFGETPEVSRSRKIKKEKQKDKIIL